MVRRVLKKVQKVQNPEPSGKGVLAEAQSEGVDNGLDGV